MIESLYHALIIKVRPIYSKTLQSNHWLIISIAYVMWSSHTNATSCRRISSLDTRRVTPYELLYVINSGWPYINVLTFSKSSQ